MTLDELAIKYGTDKSSLNHNYTAFYEQHLPKEPKRILEIGVKEGRSLAMWAEYFPGAEIHGLDLFGEISMNDVINNIMEWHGTVHNIGLHQGNQCDWRVLELLRKFDFDVIIDDGSHVARHQMITFFGLYNGKHYFIEDLHCPREPFYQDGLPYLYTADQLFPRGDGRYDVIYDKNIVLIKSPLSDAHNH